MRITNRLFTYPVLSDDKTDYLSSSFSVDFNQKMEGVSNLQLSFDISMTNADIERLILNGQAEYVIHLECSTTAYRYVVHSFQKHIEHTISIGRINGSLEIMAFVILKKKIYGFQSADWDEDYRDESFDLPAGSILAYKNVAELDITKNLNDFSTKNSIFTVYRKIVEGDVAFEVSLEANKIRIGLSTKDYDIYSNYSSFPELQQLFNAMVILPTMVYIFEELKQDDAIDLYQGKAWFKALEKSYQDRGKLLIEEIESEKTSILLAQEAMELPISQAFRQIPLLVNASEEES